MNKRSIVVVVGIVALVIAVLAGLHWNRLTVPVNDRVPGTLAIIAAGSLTAICFGAIARLRAGLIALLIGSTLAGGVVLDAFIHFIVPPETGGLFPFAAVALGVVGVLVGLVGGLIGKAIAPLFGPGDTGDGT